MLIVKLILKLFGGLVALLLVTIIGFLIANFVL